MQINAITITTVAITLCAVGLLCQCNPQARKSDVASSSGWHADAALEIAEPELVMRRTLTQVSGAAAVEARRGLGRLYEREWRLIAAESELLAALADASPPTLAAVHIDLARVRLKRGDLQGAHEAAEAAVGGASEVGVSECDIARVRGDVAKAAGRYESAKQHYQTARSKATNQDDVARVSAGECDLFQLERRLAPARQRCEQALARQTVGHPERPGTLKTLGLIYFFGGEPKRALGLHTRSQEGFAAIGNAHEARWMREFAIDDEAALLEEAGTDATGLDPIIAELEGLLAQLEQGDETLWWRVSDAQLRLADLFRKHERFPDAERMVQAALAAFEKRPSGFEQIPDYATVFELAGLVAKDQGKNEEARKHLQQSLNVLEDITGTSVDVSYLKEEIAQLQRSEESPAPLEWSPL